MTPGAIRVLTGDCRAILPTLPAASVHCVVTSPPYWGLRDYGVAGQIGLERSWTPCPSKAARPMCVAQRWNSARRELTSASLLLSPSA